MRIFWRPTFFSVCFLSPLEFQDRETATAEASHLVSAHFERNLKVPLSTENAAERSFPPYGILWAAPAIKTVVSRRLNLISAKTRSRRISRVFYNSLASSYRDPLAGDFDFPPCCSALRLLSERFGLGAEFSRYLLAPAINWRVFNIGRILSIRSSAVSPRCTFRPMFPKTSYGDLFLAS